jgi:serine/threonine protein kinase
MHKYGLKFAAKAGTVWEGQNMATLRIIVGQIVRNGRQVLEEILQRGRGGVRAHNKQNQPQPVPRAGDFYKTGTRGKSSWITKLIPLRTGQDTVVAQLRRRAALQIGEFSGLIAGRNVSQRLGHRLPLYALVGLGMSSQVTQQDAEEDMGPEWEKGFHNVCQDIQNIFHAKVFAGGEEDGEMGADTQLDDYEIGRIIAKGCNSAVYTAKLKGLDADDVSDDVGMSDGEDSFEIIPEDGSSDIIIVTEDDYIGDITVITEEQIQDLSLTDSDLSYNLAVKMMFNYDAESTSLAIVRSMRSELVPSKQANIHTNLLQWQNGTHMKKCLPYHPNVVAIETAFVDVVPCLPQALEEYPDALPTRINPDGCGRNKTLFLVMDRYKVTLREYLHGRELDLRDSLVLLTQLLEALVHLQTHQIAHRDLKSDNILISESGAFCDLAVSDFGCCLSEEHFGLVIPYLTEDVNKGGNSSLMAPEIMTMSAGLTGYLDYRKSDLWAAGAIAYEIFGADNPFYRDAEGNHLDSRYYSDQDLPDLPDHVPEIIQRLVKAMLSRDPEQRPDVVTVANCLHLLLWAPAEWYEQQAPSGVQVMRWLMTLAATSLWQPSSASVDQKLSSCFLSRLDYDAIKDSVSYLCNL